MAANVVCGCNDNETNGDAYCHMHISKLYKPRLPAFVSYFYATVITMLGQRCIKYQHLEVYLLFGTLVIELTDLASSLQSTLILTRVAMFLYCAGYENCTDLKKLHASDSHLVRRYLRQ